METWALPEINLALCNRCGICLSHCPTAAVAMSARGPEIIHPESCTYCARCDAVCPLGAITCSYALLWEASD